MSGVDLRVKRFRPLLVVVPVRYDTMRYEMRSKANMSQLNLPHARNRQPKRVKTEKKLKVENRYAQK